MSKKYIGLLIISMGFLTLGFQIYFITFYQIMFTVGKLTIPSVWDIVSTFPTNIGFLISLIVIIYGFYLYKNTQD